MSVDRTSFLSVFAVLAGLSVLLVAGSANAQVQTKEQRRCLVEMNKGFGRVAAEQGKVHKGCIKDALNEKLDGIGLHECFLSDPRGKVAEAKANTIAREATYCGGASQPSFGTSDAATVNAAAVIDEQQLIYEMFGSTVDTAIIPKAANPLRARCLIRLTRGIERIERRKRLEFLQCKRDGMRAGTITSQAELEECYEQVKQDVRQKIIKPITWLDRAVQKYCVAQGVDVDLVFPGRCVGATDFTECGNQFTDCRFCVSQNASDALTEDCEIYDDAFPNGSCLAVQCGNGVLEVNEDCDDGNTADGDCCSSTCTFEPAASPCDDGNLCTDDACDGAGTCVPTDNTVPCDDGVFCNGDDTCAGGSCSDHAGDPCATGTECADACNEIDDNCFDPAATACTDDGNVCTDDECDGAGTCAHPNNSEPCSDGVFCNGTDTCSGGTCSIHAGDPCVGGSECANDCNEIAGDCFDLSGSSCSDDGNVCTDDECDGAGSCVHPNNAEPCDDGTFCNGTDTCLAGACAIHAGNPCTGGSECADACNEGADNCFDLLNTPCTADANFCTDDVCNGAGSCSHPNNTLACNDGNACTTGDICTAGVCVGGAPPNCNDGDPCTDDSCDVGAGCLNVFNSSNPGCAPVYVSPTGTGTGTQSNPASLLTGLSLVTATNDVVMAQGTYTISNEITSVPAGVRLVGGHDPGNGWAQTGSCTSSTILRNTSNPDGASNQQRFVAVQLSGASNFTFDCLKIQTANANGSGRSTYGVHLTSSSNYLFNDVTIQAGNASAGANGSTGGLGANGSNGGNGTNGDEDSVGTRNGGGGGNGGGSGAGGGGGINGGTGGTSSNNRAGGGGGGGGAGFEGNGGTGGCGGGVSGTFGNQCGGRSGGAQHGCSGGSGGTGGSSGSTGSNGGGGSLGSSGSRSSGFWVPGGQGTTGGTGRGGQGGAGGGGGGGQSGSICDDGSGGGGGGGGGGGQASTGGSGGRGGGSSYAVFLVSNGSGGVFSGGARIAGSAGSGGLGGGGGTRGTRGTRGSGGNGVSGEVGGGGDGGYGGYGGTGGSGGNGRPGESSALILHSGTAPSVF